jgi:hypothetical protein
VPASNPRRQFSQRGRSKRSIGPFVFRSAARPGAGIATEGRAAFAFDVALINRSRSGWEPRAAAATRRVADVRILVATEISRSDDSTCSAGPVFTLANYAGLAALVAGTIGAALAGLTRTHLRNTPTRIARGIAVLARRTTGGCSHARRTREFATAALAHASAVASAIAAHVPAPSGRTTALARRARRHLATNTVHTVSTGALASVSAGSSSVLETFVPRAVRPRTI